MKFSTKAVHIGQKPEKEFGAIVPPIYMTSTYIQSAPGKYNGYDYTRSGNPNFTNLEQAIAALENASYATVFNSGLGATTAILSTLKHGDKILAVNDLYGGTHRIFSQVYEKFNLKFEFIKLDNLDDLNVLSKENIALLWVESPTNPLLNTYDIAAISKLTKNTNTVFVVDNTFATPYFQQPIGMGADIVLHSASKYLGGHSDLIGGAVVTNTQTIKEQMDFMRQSVGLNPSPFDSWLLHRGLKTLSIRMQKHQENAQRTKQFFSTRKEVKKIYYPGFSGIISIDFNLDFNQVMKMISSYKIISLAESLGSVESLVDHPASMTHASIPAEDRKKFGLPDSLIRYSIGIENIEDLIVDLEQAFNSI